MRRFAQRRLTRKIVQYVKYNIPDRNNGECVCALSLSLFLLPSLSRTRATPTNR